MSRLPCVADEAPVGALVKVLVVVPVGALVVVPVAVLVGVPVVVLVGVTVVVALAVEGGGEEAVAHVTSVKTLVSRVTEPLRASARPTRQAGSEAC